MKIEFVLIFLIGSFPLKPQFHIHPIRFELFWDKKNIGFGHDLLKCLFVEWFIC